MDSVKFDNWKFVVFASSISPVSCYLVTSWAVKFRFRFRVRSIRSFSFLSAFIYKTWFCPEIIDTSNFLISTRWQKSFFLAKMHGSMFWSIVHFLNLLFFTHIWWGRKIMICQISTMSIHYLTVLYSYLTIIVTWALLLLLLLELTLILHLTNLYHGAVCSASAWQTRGWCVTFLAENFPVFSGRLVKTDLLKFPGTANRNCESGLGPPRRCHVSVQHWSDALQAVQTGPVRTVSE